MIFKNFVKRTANIFQRNLSNQQEVLAVHNLHIKSCGSIYQNWRKSKKFRNIPSSDLIFRVKYFDSYRNSCKDLEKKPNVVALHGAPGSYEDFSSLTSFLTEKGVRVLVPSFPNFSDYRPGIFKHSDEEKAQYVKDFLSALNISHVDLLICHSSAIYPGLLLCLEQNSMIKSLAMLNPATFTLKMPAIRFYKILKFVVKASENKAFLKIMEAVCPTIMKMAGVPVRVDKFLDPLLSATVMVNADIEGEPNNSFQLLKAKQKFIELSTSGIPMFYAFSEDDKLIGGDNSYELAYFLGAAPSDIQFVNKDGIIEREGFEKPDLKVIAFENGSHYCFWKYADVINEGIYKFLLKQISKKH